MTDTSVRAAGGAAPGATGPSIRHVPGLDGVRGIAIAGVLLFHAGHAQGGFLGVDLFFVLSGFLITTLVLREWHQHHEVDLPRFWSRRVRRLLPGILAVVVATSAYAAIALDPEALHRFRWDALATLADVANWREIATGTDYWRAYEAPSPLRHAWSLSLEEQLYLVWPLLLFGGLALGRRVRRTRAPVVVTFVVLIVASIAVMVATGGSGDTTRAYYGTDTRASAALLGGLGAVLLQVRRERPGRPDRSALTAAALPAAVLLALLWIFADGEARWTYVWGLPTAGALAAVVVTAVGAGRAGALALVVELPALQWLGRMSYGLYLWHWPTYVVLDEDLGLGRWPLTGVRLVVSGALAVGSARWIERPVRDGRVSTRDWRRLAFGGLGLAVASVLVATRGAEAPATAGDGVIDEAIQGPLDGRPRVLVLGDSQAFRLAEQAVDAFAARDEDVRFGTVTMLGCGVGPGLPIADGVLRTTDLTGLDCTTTLDRFADAIADQQPDLVVLLTGAWEVLDHRIDGQDVAFGTAAWDDSTRAGLRAALAVLADGPHRTIALAASCFEPVGAGGGPKDRGDDARVQRWNELLREVAPQEGVEVLPYDQLFCGAVEPPERLDGVHLAPDGAAEVWDWLLARVDLDDVVRR